MSRIGLLDPIQRKESGHRRYSQQDIAWLEFLQRLRETGMSIHGMQEFAALRRQGAATITERRHLLEGHRQQVQMHINQLQKNLGMIEEKITYYKNMENEHADTK